MAEIQLDALAWAKMLSQKKAAARKSAAGEKAKPRKENAMAQMYVFTFPTQHPLRDYVQVIHGKDENEARQLMAKHYGTQWAFCYGPGKYTADKGRIVIGSALFRRLPNELGHREDPGCADKALAAAERLGVYEYRVNGKYMEYWSFYGSEGWYFVRYDLDAGAEVFRGANIPWDGETVPAFLKDEAGAKYNYMEG